MRTQAEADIPPELEALMAQVGPRWAASGSVAENIALMCESFAPVLARAPKHGVLVTRDIAYGEHSRQKLDVYAPSTEAERLAGGRPVVVFVHGGAFVDGHRNKNDQIYSNVLYYFARHGYVGINIEYRLAPESPYPGGTKDVGLAVAWTRSHVARFGGDSGKIFLMGHSSGAAHAASYSYDPEFAPMEGREIRGLVVVSGRVRPDFAPANPNVRKVQAYYGSDPALLERRSAISNVSKDSVPTFIAYAEYENPLIDVHCLELAFCIAQATGKAPRMAYLRRHNHTSAIAHINTSDDFLGGEIRAFIKDTLEAKS